MDAIKLEEGRATGTQPHEHDWMLVISTELEKKLGVSSWPWDQRVCRTCGRPEAKTEGRGALWFGVGRAFFGNSNLKYSFLWSRRMRMLVDSIRRRE